MSKKILLADDSITIQKVIELTFSDEDFEVVTVGNGRLAIERVQDVRPDLVLCDIIMPEKDGYEVCDFIKKNPALSRTPVLLLTGAFEPFDQERATRVGCDGFLAKPFEPQTLIAKVKDLLGRAGAPAAASTAAPAAGWTVPAAAPSAAAPAAAPAWTPYAPAVAAAPPAIMPAAAAAREPEPFAFVPEPPAPAPPTTAVPFEEAGVSFFTDETFEEDAASRPSGSRGGDTAPVPTFPETPDFDEFRTSAFDDVGGGATIALTSPAHLSPAPPAPVPTPAAPAPMPPAPAPAASHPAPVPAAARTSTPAFPAIDEDDGAQTLLHVSAEEAATLRGESPAPARPTAPPPAPPAPAPAAPAPPPAAAAAAPRPPARAPLWTQQTMEVPLETRARAAMEATAHAESEPVFEEVFETTVPPSRPFAPAPAPSPAPVAPAPAPVATSRPAPAPPEPVREPAPAPKPAPAPVAARIEPPAPKPVAAPAAAAVPAPAAAATPAPAAPPLAAVPPRAPAAKSADEPTTLSARSRDALRDADKDGAAVRSSVPSAAADAEAAAGASGVSVPVDMVSQIAQRVVAQISEKVIREVAWEVIPDLAEVLIKKEIERLKAELQRT
jgi:CheY-like chemotaxis protein